MKKSLIESMLEICKKSIIAGKDVDECSIQIIFNNDKNDFCKIQYEDYPKVNFKHLILSAKQFDELEGKYADDEEFYREVPISIALDAIMSHNPTEAKIR